MEHNWQLSKLRYVIWSIKKRYKFQPWYNIFVGGLDAKKYNIIYSTSAKGRSSQANCSLK